MEIQNLLNDVDAVEILKYAVIFIVLIGIKMKWWKASDFAVAKGLVLEGLSKKQKLESIAKTVALNTKFNETKALKEVKDMASIVVHKEEGTKDPFKNKVQRAGRKLLWNLLDGGL